MNIFTLIGSPLMWSIVTVLFIVVLFSYLLDSHIGGFVIGSVFIVWASFSRLIPAWVGVLLIVVISFTLGLGLITAFIPKGSGSSG